MRTLIAKTARTLLLCCLLLGGPAAPVFAQQENPKVLMIGIDGCRFDAILYSQAKLLKQYIKDGGHTDKCDVLDNIPTKADTASGAGWSSILTGVWADRHNVLGNDFAGNRLKDCPSILHLANRTNPKLQCIALATWQPIHEHICQRHDGCRFVFDGDKKGYKDGDRVMTQAAIDVLKTENPDLLFLYFGHLDSVGHGYGFHPKSPKYTNGIEEIDDHLIRIVKALDARPKRGTEDWLVMFFTDHGGQGKGHGGGRTVPEIRTGFLILHGAAAARGKITDKVTNVDIVPTALTHLGIAIDPNWRLPGRAVGLKKRQK
ncbi:MAG: nucleotide pyrophosphatase [Planctomycetes bacterium]|nr:nucleotide pyrophosphatase [Planctomycetota bacterium]